MPTRAEAYKSYTQGIASFSRIDDFGLDGYRARLEDLLMIDVMDQERLEIEKLLKEIAEIRMSQELPLNKLSQQDVPVSSATPKQITLNSNYNI